MSMYRDLVDEKTPQAQPASRFRPPRNAREAERARILGARVLVRAAGFRGHPISEEIKRVAARPLPERF
jgi:hypothetical protein